MALVDAFVKILDSLKISPTAKLHWCVKQGKKTYWGYLRRSWRLNK